MTVEDSVIRVVDTIEAGHAIGELRFIDYKNQTIPMVDASPGVSALSAHHAGVRHECR